MLAVFDLRTVAGRKEFDACLARLRATTSSGGEAAATVARIIEDVRQHGDDAVVSYMRKWTDARFCAERICVPSHEITTAANRVDAPLKRAIEEAIDHVRAYQEHVKPQNPRSITIADAELGLRFTPVRSVALLVPGGAAVLFSTLIMLAVPALVAGVEADRIAVVNPPPNAERDQTPTEISPPLAATCVILGIEKLYRIGGAQAVAAVALGTQRVDQVDLVAGPGNVFVQLAKAQLNGVVGTDGGFYGPSEITTIADESANPSVVASDLIAQAEHDPGKCFLVAWSGQVIDRVMEEISRQLPQRERQRAIDSALRTESCALRVADQDQAIEVVNAIASEHVNLAVSDPDSMLGRIRHAGEVFLGDQTPVAAGDYYAGPSHCLPTGTTARFASGLSVYSFLKRTSTVSYRQGMTTKTANAIACLADAEGLDGHAASARARG